MCGTSAGETDDHGRLARLHVGHIVARFHGGNTTLGNLRALCSRCNQGAKHITQEPPSWTWLLAQLRRSSQSDQKKALKWLKNKFESSTHNT